MSSYLPLNKESVTALRKQFPALQASTMDSLLSILMARVEPNFRNRSLTVLRRILVKGTPIWVVNFQ